MWQGSQTYSQALTYPALATDGIMAKERVYKDTLETVVGSWQANLTVIVKGGKKTRGLAARIHFDGLRPLVVMRDVR